MRTSRGWYAPIELIEQLDEIRGHKSRNSLIDQAVTEYLKSFEFESVQKHFFDEYDYNKIIDICNNAKRNDSDFRHLVSFWQNLDQIMVQVHGVIKTRGPIFQKSEAS